LVKSWQPVILLALIDESPDRRLMISLRADWVAQGQGDPPFDHVRNHRIPRAEEIGFIGHQGQPCERRTPKPLHDLLRPLSLPSMRRVAYEHRPDELEQGIS
jgi:hypothetical protein